MITLSNEGIFYTIQGEGKYIGYPTTFVRTSMCNLRCAWTNPDGSITRCDTPHTSFNPERDVRDIQEVAKEINDQACEHVCITGGEPYVQKLTLIELVQELKAMGHYITVETNGTIYFDTEIDFISLSPKLSSSSSDPNKGKVHEKKRLNYDSLEQFIKNHNYQFKFVYNSKEDVKEILDIRDNLFDRTGININDNIWLMPQGIIGSQFDEKSEEIADICKFYGWKMTDRLHIRIWKYKKGV